MINILQIHGLPTINHSHILFSVTKSLVVQTVGYRLQSQIQSEFLKDGLLFRNFEIEVIQ